MQRFLKFLEEVREEMRRVSWPTRDDLMGSALVVFVGVFLLSGYISLCNFVLSRMSRLVFLR
ncbi:MAG: preprotein translocase subunit SecE [Candidatus Omnitrophica bacterium]|nr:preprotein translocase subunit SecE [Candidatus Omnitrophota bacterium]